MLQRDVFANRAIQQADRLKSLGSTLDAAISTGQGKKEIRKLSCVQFKDTTSFLEDVL
jgi:hypothetical protein